MYLLSFLGGILFYSSSPSILGWPIFSFLLLPWFWSLDKSKTTKEIFWLYVALSAACNATLHFWMPLSLSEMWHYPRIVSFLLWLPMALFSEVTYFIWPFLLKIIFKKNIKDLSIKEVLLWSVFWAVLEKGGSILAPDEIGLGFTQYDVTTQILDLSGVSLASSLLFLINLCMYKIFLKQYKYIALLVLSLGSMIGYGTYVINKVDDLTLKSKETINALIIQPNLNHHDREASRTGVKDKVEFIMNSQYNQTLQSLKQYPKTDIVFWPETTYPFFFGSSNTVYEAQTEKKLHDFVKENNINLFLGSFGKKPEDAYVYNSVYLLSPGEKTISFDKTLLFPFGEYIPFVDTFPWLVNVFPNAITPKESPKIHAESFKTTSGKTFRAGSSICYEVFFESIFRELALQDVDFSFNASNESWFYPIGEPGHAIVHARARAAMNKKPIFKSANTGHSAVIDEAGRVLAETPMDVKREIYYELPRISYGPTLYLKYGDWFSKIGSLILLLSLIRLYIRNQKKD